MDGFDLLGHQADKVVYFEVVVYHMDYFLLRGRTVVDIGENNRTGFDSDKLDPDEGDAWATVDTLAIEGLLENMEKVGQYSGRDSVVIAGVGLGIPGCIGLDFGDVAVGYNEEMGKFRQRCFLDLAEPSCLIEG